VSVWEPREKDVEPFVKEWGDRMGYTVASDRVEGITAADDEQRSREAVDKGLMSKKLHGGFGLGGNRHSLRVYHQQGRPHRLDRKRGRGYDPDGPDSG